MIARTGPLRRRPFRRPGRAPALAAAQVVLAAALVTAAPEERGTITFAGMRLEDRAGRIVVAEVTPGSSADRAGVMELDTVLVIDDVNLIDLQPFDVEAIRPLLRRARGAEVRLVLGRGPGTLRVALDEAATAPPGPAVPAQGAALKPGALAPAFSGTDLRGGEIALRSLIGRPVLITFWASWCPPCRNEALVLRRIAAACGEALHVVGVSLDTDRRAYEAFVYNHHLPGRQVFDGGPAGPIATVYGIGATGVPHAVLLDSRGRVAAAGPSLAGLEAELDGLIPECRAP